jgi:ketosteroid isomerase-like protein
MATEGSAVAVVQAMYQRLGSGDPAGARSMWADDAVWHLTGSHPLAKDYDPDAYLQMLAEWAGRYPSYEAEYQDVRDLGEDVAIIVMQSTGGMAPGVATGLLVYRVVDGIIREGWAIPTFADGRYAF